jgi:hypothetical protein
MKRTCASCGGELFQFTALPSIKGVSPPLLPTACRRCGEICIDGTPLRLDEGFERRVAAVDEQAALQGRLACEELVAEANERIANAFAGAYRTGYVSGLIRALEWLKHEMKEGRLKRLRRLWRDAERVESDKAVDVRLSPAAFTEFDRLIEWEPKVKWAPSAKEEHGAGPPNTRRTG